MEKCLCENLDFSFLSLVSSSYFFLLAFPASFPQWSRSEVSHSSSAVENVHERRPLIEEVADTEHEEEQGDGFCSY